MVLVKCNKGAMIMLICPVAQPCQPTLRHALIPVETTKRFTFLKYLLHSCLCHALQQQLSMAHEHFKASPVRLRIVIKHHL